MNDIHLRVVRRVKNHVFRESSELVSSDAWRILWNEVREPIGNQVGPIFNSVQEVLEGVSTYDYI